MSYIRRLHTCMMCDWFRDVVTGDDANKIYIHQKYGRVTYRIAAELDVKTHDCEVHTRLVKYLRRYILKGSVHA